MSHYFFRNLKGSIKFNHSLRGQDHINKHIKAVTMMFNWVCQATATPLIYFDDLTVMVVDDLLDALQNSACLLFADFGVENEAQFIVTPHEATSFLWVCIWTFYS